MSYLIARGVLLGLAILGSAVAQEPGIRLGTAVARSGKTIIEGTASGHRVTITIDTAVLAGECAQHCPSSLDWITQEGMEPVAKEAAVVKEMTVTLDGAQVWVPIPAYLGLFQLNRASIRSEGDQFILSVDGADGALGYQRELYFGAAGVDRMKDYSFGKLGEDTRFIRVGDPATTQFSSALTFNMAKLVRREIKGPGSTELEMMTSRGKVSAKVLVAVLGSECVTRCPDSGEWQSDRSKTIFREEITLSVAGEKVLSRFSTITTNPHWVILGSEQQSFVLRIEGGSGPTGNFVEFQAQPDGTVRTMRSVYGGVIEETHSYPIVIE